MLERLVRGICCGVVGHSLIGIAGPIGCGRVGGMMQTANTAELGTSPLLKNGKQSQEGHILPLDARIDVLPREYMIRNEA